LFLDGPHPNIFASFAIVFLLSVIVDPYLFFKVSILTLLFFGLAIFSTTYEKLINDLLKRHGIDGRVRYIIDWSFMFAVFAIGASIIGTVLTMLSLGASAVAVYIVYTIFQKYD
jgi:hypothetical protein